MPLLGNWSEGHAAGARVGESYVKFLTESRPRQLTDDEEYEIVASAWHQLELLGFLTPADVDALRDLVM